jgi:hypothetical protein
MVFACDAVSVAEQRLYPLGAGLHSLSTPALPLVLPSLGVGMIAYVSDGEAGSQHSFEIGLSDPAGQPCHWRFSRPAGLPQNGLQTSESNPLAGELTFGEDISALLGAEQVVVGAFNFRDVTLPQPGAYSIDVRIGELAHAAIPLQVIHRE